MSLDKLVATIHDSVDTRIRKGRGSTIRLTENNENAACKGVTINARGLRPLLLEIDQKGLEVHPLLASDQGLKIKCDYIIICPYNKKLYFLIIELKSENVGGWMKQCMAGECLIRYIISTLERVHKIEIAKHAEYRYLLFSTNEDAYHQGVFKKNTSDRQFRYLENKINENTTIKFTEKTCNRTYDDLRIFLTD